MGVKLPDQKWFRTTQLDANRVEYICAGIYCTLFYYFVIYLYYRIGKGQVKDKAKVSRSYFNTSFLTFVQPRT